MPRLRVLFLALAAALALPLVAATPASAAVAPGCTTDRLTAIGGALYGAPDNRSLNALVGFDLKDADGRTVDASGARYTQGGYGYVDRLNPTIPATGSTDTSLDRHWGARGSRADLCVSATVRSVFLEVYPKNPDGVTDKSRYGAAAHYYQPITVGARNDFLLRLPVDHAFGGNTGYVNGYVTYGGHRVDPASITRVRMFTRGRGPECGIEGFSASADSKAYSSSLDATYYRVDHLAGGRCGATTQSYTLSVDCTCGGVKRTLSRAVDIADGQGTRVDLAF